MIDKFLCVMAGYDEETEHYLSSIQREIYESGFTGTHTKELPQHITLGTFPVNHEEQTLEILINVCSEIRSFEVTFNHIGIFGGSKVLFVAPDPNRELFSLKEHFGSIFDWTPHTTMLIDEPGEILRALPIVSRKFSKFRGRIERLFLYEFWPTRHICSMDLKK